MTQELFEPLAAATKICSKCRVEKARTEFYKRSLASDGLRSQCKACMYDPRPEYHAKYYRKNTEKIRENTNEYREKNPHIKWEYHYRQREIRCGRTPVIESFTLEQLEERWGSICYDCGDVWAELDHVIPVSAGGIHSLENCQPVCSACNKSRWKKFKMSQ